MDREQFGAFLVELRKEKGWTQKELAEKLFVTDKAVSKWERGMSIPDPALLMPLAEALGVTVTELLRGERTETDELLERREVEKLVEKTIRLSAQEQQRRQEERQKWKKRWWLCLPLAVLATVWLLLAGPLHPSILSSVLTVEGLCLGFGAYMCFGIKETLPAYYDENCVTTYGDGAFRMNLAGIAFNNRNWPHIIRACRQWLVSAPVVFPLLCLILGAFLPPVVWLPLSLIAALGFFVPVMYVAKKYE